MKTEETPPTSGETAVDVQPSAETEPSSSDDQKGEGDGERDGKPAETKKRKSEPASERLPNFSRVTPAQLAHIVFPPEGRFQPVRPVSTRSPKSSKGKAPLTASPAKTPTAAALGVTSERYAGGGGILILIDQAPEEPVEFIEEEVPAPPAPPAEPTATAAGVPVGADSQPAGPHISLDENAPEADPPASFEVRTALYQIGSILTCSPQYPFED